MADDKKNKKTLVGIGSELPAASEAAEAASGALDDAQAEAAEAAKAAEADSNEAVEKAEAGDDAAQKAEGAADDVAEAAEDEAAASAEEDADADEAEAKVEAAADDAEDETNVAAAELEAKAEADEVDAAEEEAQNADEPAAETASHGDGGANERDDERDSDPGDEPQRRPALYLAQYETPQALYDAACEVRDAGFEKWDCHTPYPVHGLDDAMGLPPTKIGIISFAHAMIGLVTAVLMIQYMNNWDYPIIVGGKPAGSFPSMVPIMFELTVLLTGFGTLFGLLHLARLPRHHHPIFESDRFAKATDDKFFISIEVQDPKFDLENTKELLEGTSPSYIELVEEELV
ncbi:MAG: DUF3341 domain-containing protein [Myxococcota bacterium]